MAGFGEIVALAKGLGGSGGGSSGGGVLVVNFTWNDDDSADLDKTWQEMFDAASEGTPVVIKNSSSDSVYCFYLFSIEHSGNYQVDILQINGGTYPDQLHFETNSATGYPHMSA